MNQLKTTEQTMSSREIAALTDKRHAHVMRDIREMFAALETSETGVPKFGDTLQTDNDTSEEWGKEHKNVLRDVRSMFRTSEKDALKSQDISTVGDRLKSERIYTVGGVLKSQDTPKPYTNLQNGQTYYEYHLNREMTDLLLTSYSVILRLKVIRRWRELEAIVAPKLPVSYIDALKALVASEEMKAELQEQLTIAAPKAAFVDRYVTAKTGDLGFRQAAKLFEIKETVFRSWLIANRVLYILGGEWTAYAEHVTAGHVTTKVGEAIVSSHAYTQVKFTPKGITYLAKKLSDAGLISS
jgi:phage antirepressor YoqD-like protein